MTFQVTTLAYGWSVQPEDDWDTTWSDKVWSSGDLRAPQHPESGHRIVAKQYSVEAPSNPPPTLAMYRGRILGQCWCGRQIGPVTFDMVRSGVTFTCGYYRCPQIAGMSHSERVAKRPHHKASRPRALHKNPVGAS